MMRKQFVDALNVLVSGILHVRIMMCIFLFIYTLSASNCDGLSVCCVDCPSLRTVMGGELTRKTFQTHISHITNRSSKGMIPRSDVTIMFVCRVGMKIFIPFISLSDAATARI